MDAKEEKAALKEVEFMTNKDYKHENLMSAQYHFFHKKCLYIVMKKMDGSLSDLIHGKDEKVKELKALLKKQPGQLLYLLIQIARGVQKLHYHSIMHRDIKPGNVLIRQKIVNENIEIDCVKLSDFGISRQAPAAKTVTGTENYMAPEIKRRNLSGYTEKADIYSFGIMLGEIVCSTEEVNKEEYTQENFKKTGYEYLFKLYEKCTRLEPNDRPNIDQILGDLEFQYEKIKLNQYQEKTREMITRIDKTVDSLNSQYELHCKRTEETKNEIIRHIEDRARELSMDLEKNKTSAINTIKDYKRKFESIKRDLEENCSKKAQDIEKLLDFKNTNWDGNIQNLRKLNTITNETIQKLVTEPNMNDSLQSNLEVCLDTKELFEKIKNWGCAEVLVLSINNCEVFGLLNKVLLNKKTHFRVYLRTKNGRSIGVMPPVVRITADQEQKLRYEIEYNESRGFYTVTYIPIISGSHLLQVFVNGENLIAEPYSVQTILSFMEHKETIGERGKELAQFDYPYSATTCHN